jgi:hypothetical protein
VVRKNVWGKGLALSSRGGERLFPQGKERGGIPTQRGVGLLLPLRTKLDGHASPLQRDMDDVSSKHREQSIGVAKNMRR